MKYVILRSPAATSAPKAAGRRGDRRAAASATATTKKAKTKVEVADLGPKSAAKEAEKKEVLALAPVMPMKLISPMKTKKPKPAKKKKKAAASGGGVAWGIRAVGADTSPFDGDGVVVAVLDTGIDADHPAFAGVNLVQKNFTDDAPEDEHGHGTHCAGTIFGRDVNGNRIGIARGVKKALIGKVLGETGGGSDRIVEAIQWAISEGAHIISMSLGIDFPGFVKELEDEGFPTELATSVALEGYRANILLFNSLASLVTASGMFGRSALLVAAAGNESRRELNADFEIAVSPPAVSEGFVSVAAVGESSGGLTIADFSNTGAKVSGPGVDILSARLGGKLISFDGTSMATPHVAGVAALWAEKLMQSGAPLNIEQLKLRLISKAITDPLKAGFDPADVGEGLVQAPQS